MYINDASQTIDSCPEQNCRLIQRSGESCLSSIPILSEHRLDIYINEKLTMKLVCTPDHLKELVLGRLYTEGIIASISEIELLYLCKEGLRAKVTLTRHERKETSLFVEETPTCCTDNRMLNDKFVRYADLSPLPSHHWEPEWIFALADLFSKGTPLHLATRATHSCFLARRTEVLFSCEDIGRHNAIDKAVGYALEHDIDLSECILYSSGRVPTDMVRKVIRARIPVFCTKATPSSQAVQLAQNYGMTLIGSARRENMILYSE